MGAHTIAWLFLLSDSVILLVVFGSRRVFFDDWLSILINVGDDMLTLVTSIILLVGIHKKSPQLHLPFIIVNVS
jgi:type IV secretory pathway VirB6-like protein